MSYRNLLTHRCDVYHLMKDKSEGAWGIPGSDLEEEFSYGKIPNLTAVPCYFTEKNQSILQGEPNPTVIQSFLVHFLPSADIRMNDKIIWNGIELILQIPKKIKNHHIEVTATRSERL
ncbi:DUF3599 family protein [Pseudobacillus wudalianchiensis]|uniref:DUF3599 domain-containing protein n=1 Tax=Pseudobacillus wudalianchiensis TaxID=1743143 RepID=A0A1B9AN21_9BACI|nr:DUF3599 family protein [Bacillus wudalianchiensis]OCA85232.1 DUF3599 domain-containing protein [Bacillus wudalianchiensis]